MIILSHRGYWQQENEKNTVAAFQRSFTLGFGTETDVRDYCGRLVIAHDIADASSMDFEDFLDLAEAANLSHPFPLALNIKADGLATLVHTALDRRPALDAFVFDMSIPDMRGYLSAGIPVFTRMSEVEQQPVWLAQAKGVWLDGFESEWFDTSLINNLLTQGKQVCIVSPELHRRPYMPLWQQLVPLVGYPGLMLCTDYPQQAVQHFVRH